MLQEIITEFSRICNISFRVCQESTVDDVSEIQRKYIIEFSNRFTQDKGEIIFLLHPPSLFTPVVEFPCDGNIINTQVREVDLPCVFSQKFFCVFPGVKLSLIHISEPTRLLSI